MNWQVQPPLLLRRLHADRLWRMPAEKKLYLTFDDGPTPGVTDEALDILKRFNAQATFFCVGANAERHPEFFQRILQDGHAAGNHTQQHLNGWKTDTRVYLDDVARCAEIFSSSLFRPPYGRLKPTQSARLRAQGYRIVMWDVLSCDYEQGLRAEECLELVLEHTRAGSIVVFHDSVKAAARMLPVLPKVLERFGNEGYSFERLL